MFFNLLSQKKNMAKAYILNSCSTCQRIINEIDWQGEIQNIKEKNIEAKVLDRLAKEHGSYEALFSKRAMKYRSLGLNKMDLGEKDFRKYILEEYTFLKRPVFVFEERSFVGNAKSTVQQLKNYLADGQK
jgi:arsenate reductase